MMTNANARHVPQRSGARFVYYVTSHKLSLSPLKCSKINTNRNNGVSSGTISSLALVTEL